jgi:hypothetical protein
MRARPEARPKRGNAMVVTITIIITTIGKTN